MNAIIDIDEGRAPHCTALRDLISLNGKHDIEVFRCVASAAERQKNGDISEKYENYEDRIQRRDVETFVSIVENGGGVFVTRDRRFHEKREALEKGANEYNGTEIDVLEPIDALRKAKQFIDGCTSNTASPNSNGRDRHGA